MRNIVYGSSTVLVADDVADAVLRYAAVLATTGTSDVVHIPTVDDMGYAARVTVLLGPGIPVMVVAAPDDLLEEASPQFVADMSARSRVALDSR